ncbi:MAG: pseudouridine synthase [Cytophagales bacterium]|nr:pseudouridine synthase [Cytophagales bacterium]
MNNEQPQEPIPMLPSEHEAREALPSMVSEADAAPEQAAPEPAAPDPVLPVAPTPVFELDDIVSGRFDEEQASEEVTAPGKRVLAPEVESPKLHKILAQAGLGSRLEMEQMIVEGRITVNKEPAHIGMRIRYGDQIAVNGKPIKVRIDPPPARILAYHKPAGEVVTHDDPQNRPTVFRRLPKLYQGKWQSVGRLDLNTEGLLLFTSSGELANRLTHPRFGLEREYAVRVLGALSNEEKQQLLDGVMLDDGLAQFGSIEDGGGEGANCWYRVTISEGRNREVRRMVESLGHAVSRLIRIRYGTMLLPKGLKRGFWMELDEADVRALQNASGGAPKRADGEGAAPRSRAGNGGGHGRNDQRGANRGRGRASPDRGGYKGNTPRPDNRNAPRPTAPGEGGGRGSYGGNSGGRSDGNAFDGDGINNDRLPSGINPERTMMDFKRQAFGGGNGGGGGGGNGGGRGRGRSGGGNGGGGNGGGGNGGGGNRAGNGSGNALGNGGQPDPMRTSFGYIGADSLQRQRSAPSGNRGGNRSGNRGGTGNSAGGRGRAR